MSVRLLLPLVLALLVSACAAPSDRYAFWRDDPNAANIGHKPNLGDVPNAPPVDNIKAEMDAMRIRMEQDRDNAVLAAQSENPAMGLPATQMTGIEMMNTTSSDILVSPMEAPQSMQNRSGNVVYNYGTTNTDNNMPYVYGFSPVNIRAAAENRSPGHDYVVSDPSVSVDWSALGGENPQNYMTSNNSSFKPAVTGEPAVYFGYGSARLTAADRKKLQDMTSRTYKSVVVIGYASKQTGISDITRSHAVNLKMSAARANAVMHELARLGVSPDAMNVTAYGDTLAQGNQSEDQRVEIKFD